jgi:hypothetical protein
MSFLITLRFATENEKEAFRETGVPKVRGHLVDPPPTEGEEASLAVPSLAIAVTSASAARDLCHQLVAFQAHKKGGLVEVVWRGADGSEQVGQVDPGSAKEAEILAVRLAAAVKASSS